MKQPRQLSRLVELAKEHSGLLRPEDVEQHALWRAWLWFYVLSQFDLAWPYDWQLEERYATNGEVCARYDAQRVVIDNYNKASRR